MAYIKAHRGSSVETKLKKSWAALVALQKV
jgi:hypothetical protein